MVAGESAVFAVAGGALGLALARGLLALARWLEPGRIPRLDAVTLDGRVVLAVLGVTALSALAVGEPPPWPPRARPRPTCSGAAADTGPGGARAPCSWPPSSP